MVLQARMSQDDARLYNPSRDVAHNFKEVLELVAARLEDQAWPELVDVLKREEVTMDDLGEACAAYCQYVASAIEHPNRPMQVSLEVAGFFKCKSAAQVAVLAMIGTCYAGIQHAGIRDATIGGEGPMASVNDLLESADRVLRYTGSSRLARRWYRFKERIKNALKAFRGAK